MFYSVGEKMQYLDKLESSNECFFRDRYDAIPNDCRVYLWGCGIGVYTACKRTLFNFEGIIDNDRSKIGEKISKYVIIDKGRIKTSYVLSSDILEHVYSYDDIAVVICSLKYYDEIAAQLQSIGIKYYYSIKHLEALEGRFALCSGDYNDIIDGIIKHENINDNKIVVMGMPGYSNHEKYVIQELVQLDNKLEIIWIADHIESIVPNYIRLIGANDRENLIYEMETAKIILSSNALPQYFIKRKEQIYIHLKHWSSITLKKFFLDAPSVYAVENLRKLFEKNASEMDYIIVGSEFDENSCRRGLSNRAKFVYCGSPRTDILFSNNDYKLNLCKLYGIKNECNILLFAPTYRFSISDNTKAQRLYKKDSLDFYRLKNTLERKTSQKWVMLLRLHPSLKWISKQIADEAGLIDVTQYDDSQELVAACDAMISDYSSIMFEPAFVYKPVFLYAPDLDEYIRDEYELLLDYRSLPFPIAETLDDLYGNILNFNYDTYKSDVENFFKKYGVHEDGHASERAAKFIMGLLNDSDGEW